MPGEHGPEAVSGICTVAHTQAAGGQGMRHTAGEAYLEGVAGIGRSRLIVVSVLCTRHGVCPSVTRGAEGRSLEINLQELLQLV